MSARANGRELSNWFTGHRSSPEITVKDTKEPIESKIDAMWVNAYNRAANYQISAQPHRLERIDACFPLFNKHHLSLGKACQAGQRAITVDADGIVRRCHFVDQPLGNLYAGSLDSLLRPRTCPNETCHCYIGYSHMNELGLYEVYGNDVLARIPLRV